jgi:hypothetical protein
MFTPNREILQTNVVVLQSAINQIRGIIQNIILGIDKISQDKKSLMDEMKSIEQICVDSLFSAKYEVDE